MSAQNKASKEPQHLWGQGWGRALLISSLALNLLFVGAIVGAGWMRHKFHGPHGGPPDFVIKRMLGDLPGEKQSQILALLKDHRKIKGEKIRSIRAEVKLLRKVLNEDQLDTAKIRQAGQKLHSIRGELVHARTQLLIGVLEKLTPQERRKVLESRLFRRLFRPRRHSFGRSGH